MSTKLVEWHKFIPAEVVGDAVRDDLLNEFAKAFDELDGAVQLGQGHVLLVVLGDDCHKGFLPGMVVYSQGDVIALHFTPIFRHF